ncbi:hypothetical protein FXO09_23325 [Microcystis aeruginosa KLA2]|nr:MAG: hypothetical protein EWV62_04120 [Microcystis aeruginosa Ma_OC_LR_19540900_S633]TYT68936.1 hypothetical protein FXO09_23325 [Microcystis aeruginosa KLA2]
MEKYLETFRSWSSGDRIQETGDRRLFYLFSPHPTPHTLALGKTFCRKPQLLSIKRQRLKFGKHCNTLAVNVVKTRYFSNLY